MGRSMVFGFETDSAGTIFPTSGIYWHSITLASQRQCNLTSSAGTSEIAIYAVGFRVP